MTKFLLFIILIIGVGAAVIVRSGEPMAIYLPMNIILGLLVIGCGILIIVLWESMNGKEEE